MKFAEENSSLFSPIKIFKRRFIEILYTPYQYFCIEKKNMILSYCNRKDDYNIRLSCSDIIKIKLNNGFNPCEYDFRPLDVNENKLIYGFSIFLSRYNTLSFYALNMIDQVSKSRLYKRVPIKIHKTSKNSSQSLPTESSSFINYSSKKYKNSIIVPASG